MNSFVEGITDSTTEIKDIKPKILHNQKIHTFYIFYQNNLHFNNNRMSVLEVNIHEIQKISFKLKDQKNYNSSDMQHMDQGRLIQLSFYQLDQQNSILYGLNCLKNGISQGTLGTGKTKIIIYGSEGGLIELILKAKALNIDIYNIPIAIYCSRQKNDLSYFLGWNTNLQGDLSNKSISDFETDVKSWIKSPAEKVDLWQADIVVNEENGQIHYIADTQVTLIKNKFIKQYFVSHLGIGYHPKIQMQYEKQKNGDEQNWLNKLRYAFEHVKGFCCIGSSQLSKATGIISINFTEPKGEEIQILRNFKEGDGDQDHRDHQESASKLGRKDILSVVMANIDRYNGEKLKSSTAIKTNDKKLQLLTYESSRCYHKITSVSGQIKLKLLQSSEVNLQIGDRNYKLIHPIEIRVRLSNKIKLAINKNILQC